MMMTLFCDASLCMKTGSAGWGAWAKCDGWLMGRFYGGPIDDAANSTVAELIGISSGLTSIAERGELDGVKVLMIQCDNIAALAAIGTLSGSSWSRSEDKRDSSKTMRRGNLSDRETAALKAISKAVAGRTVMLRHVKGHVNGTGRNWVNQQCDREARRHMQAQRARHQSGQVSA